MSNARADRIKILKHYLEEDPNDHFSRYALALEAMETGESEEAILLMEEVIRQNSDFLAAYYQLGKAYEMNQQNDRAIRTYKKGLEIARLQENTKTERELRSALFSLQDDDE